MSSHAQDHTATVYSTSDPFDAEIVANALRNEGILCSVLNSHQAGLTGSGITSVEIMVREIDADRAVSYIKKTSRTEN